MSTLPDVITTYLAMIDAPAGRVTYAFLDPQGRITSWGGDVEMMAPLPLDVGGLAVDEFPGLVGLVPVSSSSVVIPNLQLAPGLIVHLHAIPVPAGHGALILIDASPGYEDKRRKQQQRYDQKLAERVGRRKPKS